MRRYRSKYVAFGGAVGALVGAVVLLLSREEEAIDWLGPVTLMDGWTGLGLRAVDFLGLDSIVAGVGVIFELENAEDVSLTNARSVANADSEDRLFDAWGRVWKRRGRWPLLICLLDIVAICRKECRIMPLIDAHASIAIDGTFVGAGYPSPGFCRARRQIVCIPAGGTGLYHPTSTKDWNVKHGGTLCSMDFGPMAIIFDTRSHKSRTRRIQKKVGYIGPHDIRLMLHKSLQGDNHAARTLDRADFRWPSGLADRCSIGIIHSERKGVHA